MGTYTTNYNLFMPSIGEQGWGELVNRNFTTIDATMKGLDTRLTTVETYGSRITAIENEVNGNLNCTSVTTSKINGGWHYLTPVIYFNSTSGLDGTFTFKTGKGSTITEQNLSNGFNTPTLSLSNNGLPSAAYLKNGIYRNAPGSYNVSGNITIRGVLISLNAVVNNYNVTATVYANGVSSGSKTINMNGASTWNIDFTIPATTTSVYVHFKTSSGGFIRFSGYVESLGMTCSYTLN